MTYASQLCLGTVQFGLPYGITNRAGQVSELEVRRILDLAAASEIILLDTAQAYGTAEEVIGCCWPSDAPRRLISKLTAGATPDTWESSFITSLRRLRATKLDALLLHSASDLLAPDGDALLKWLEALRDRGLVDRIGVSIYEASELERLPLDRLQLVQLPLSVYDQRLFLDGTLARLHEQGIAVHARSVLLQGLILESPNNLPDHLSADFRDHHSEWLKQQHQEGRGPLAGAIGFVRACYGVEAVLVGVASVQELAQVLDAWSQTEGSPFEPSLNWAWDNVMDIDPRRWP